MPISGDVRRTVEGLAGWGFRPIAPSDLAPGQEIVMVEVERFASASIGLSPYSAPGCTIIVLASKPVGKRKIRNRDVDYVFYHCMMPRWDGDCFVPLQEFVWSGCADDPYGGNDTRYFIKN